MRHRAPRAREEGSLSQAAASAISLGAAAAWGAGDFTGGLAARRAPALRVASTVQFAGALLLAAAALLTRAPLPSAQDAAWAAAAGACGAVGLASLYAALASGRMGIAAPISGVVTTLPPVAAGLWLEGAPGAPAFAGFGLALAGVVLVAAPRAERPPTRVLGLATLAGVGFGGFLLALDATSGSLLWVLVLARLVAGGLVALAALARGELAGPMPPVALLAALLDTAGNLLFLVATRAGRLDIAAVLSSLYPVATVLLASLLLRERLTAPQRLGALLVLVAIPLVSL